MKNIRGTILYFRNALNDLLAMMQILGPPTLFVTLSADDMHWPELGMLLHGQTYHDASTNPQNFDGVRSNPLLAGIHFQRRFHALLKYIIHGDSQPLGKVVD